MKDPLSDSRSILAMFREHCRGIAIKEIDAGNFTVFLFYVLSFCPLPIVVPYICTILSGHCPHDELPNEVNSIIKEWVVTLESEVSPVTSKQFE